MHLRATLLDRIDRASPRVVRIVAGPGWGKSTFVRALTARASSAAVVEAAEAVDREEFERLVLDALAAVRGPLEAGSLREAWAAPGIPDVVVLEDLHALDAASVDVVRVLLRAMPPGRSLVMTSRAPLPFELSRYFAPHEISSLTAQDLALTEDERRTVIDDDGRLDPRTLERAVALSRGWPICTYLFGRFAREGRLTELLDRLEDRGSTTSTPTSRRKFSVISSPRSSTCCCSARPVRRSATTTFGRCSAPARSRGSMRSSRASGTSSPKTVRIARRFSARRSREPGPPRWQPCARGAPRRATREAITAPPPRCGSPTAIPRTPRRRSNASARRFPASRRRRRICASCSACRSTRCCIRVTRSSRCSAPRAPPPHRFHSSARRARSASVSAAPTSARIVCRRGWRWLCCRSSPRSCDAPTTCSRRSTTTSRAANRSCPNEPRSSPRRVPRCGRCAGARRTPPRFGARYRSKTRTAGRSSRCSVLPYTMGSRCRQATMRAWPWRSSAKWRSRATPASRYGLRTRASRRRGIRAVSTTRSGPPRRCCARSKRKSSPASPIPRTTSTSCTPSSCRPSRAAFSRTSCCATWRSTSVIP